VSRRRSGNRQGTDWGCLSCPAFPDFVHDLRNDLNAASLKFYLTEINTNMPELAATGEAVGKVIKA
jgi:hypothetical protein